MTKRVLKRQLNLAQVIMLGTAGTLASEIFVLTGHAAGMAGPGAVLALLIGGILSYSVALNYCELATTYPVTGGAMSYVREAYGNGILSYLVGSMDCISSTFYAALSAVGFGYSLQVLVPGLPIVPVALIAIGVFSVLNILGVTKVGNIQIVLGGILLAVFVLFVIAGFVSPNGFSWQTYTQGKGLLIGDSFAASMSMLLGTIALVYSAYVGFEVIADDAEEVSNPNRTIPVGILVSLTLCTLIYVTVALVALGTVPWQQLAGSETTLTDVVRHFLPGWGVPMMAVAGMIATLTSINSAMLSATREAFTLGRNGVWPRPLTKLSRLRTPYVAILAIGVISGLIAAIGLVDFLSYIASAGYLFVLFWGSLSMIRLRKRYPNIERPFKAPLFPLTAYAAGASCLLIIIFADWRALTFGAGVLGLFALAYYVAPHVSSLVLSRVEALEPDKDLILVAARNPRTARSLVHLGAIVGQASEDSYICVLTVETRGDGASTDAAASAVAAAPLTRPGLRNRYLLSEVSNEAQLRNVALYTKSRTAANVSVGILAELAERDNTKLVLAGWPKPMDPGLLANSVVKQLVQRGHTNVAVLLDRGLNRVDRILIPIGGGPHSRLAIRLAYEIALAEGTKVTALHIATAAADDEEKQDQSALLEETIVEVLGAVPDSFAFVVSEAESVLDGILAESTRQDYDLIIIGASEEWALPDHLFGAIGDRIATMASCSVLLCRRHEPVTIAWLRHQIKTIERHEQRNGNGKGNGKGNGHS